MSLDIGSNYRVGELKILIGDKGWASYKPHKGDAFCILFLGSEPKKLTKENEAEWLEPNDVVNALGYFGKSEVKQALDACLTPTNAKKVMALLDARVKAAHGRADKQATR